MSGWSSWTVGWLILAAAGLIAAIGFASRVLVGRRRNSPAVRRTARGLRRSLVGRILFGPTAGDALEDGELDQMILMPTIVVASGLCLTGIFLLGYAAIT